ncbi:NAD(P)-dependent oxidoreductase [Cohnella thailandensis]|uniref:NAD(P)-dependent oxidoreductase n=1 Tax=Cohnella thailandensis TaxID=557557 RepID=A0A841SY68_9BACL|nr:NAD(P)-dependent oxidoreductase [Cohnella thailandensis]MBB6635118.1 NAD(P)-dependent oxidoreductase [Cohnella thailandensis]MBP1974416.1 putative homoserine dehydrogenase-like protein [Cohnella thailandensis]
MANVKRIGVVGTGLIGRGLIMALENDPDFVISRILTRRDIQTMQGFPSFELLTNSADKLIESSDLIVECSGDVLYGTDVIDKAINASIPVVTMNSELQVTTGSYFARRGLITEAEGDQPGCLAALHENVKQMGFKPLVYGNVKGFLKLDPTEEEMEYWSKRNGTSLEMTTSFTDGTKVQIEQVFVANGLGAGIAEDGLLGVLSDDAHSGGVQLADKARELGYPVSDYILSPKTPPGVFITAEIDERHKDALRYYKMGEGPYYTLLVNYHLCHLEILKTIRRVLSGGGVLLNNGTHPRISAAAVAKQDLYPGHEIKRGIGSFEVRGIAVEIGRHAEHVPIGLLSDAVITRPVREGQILTFDDVEIPNSLALRAWLEIKESVLHPSVEIA